MLICVAGDAALSLNEFDAESGALTEIDRIAMPDGAGPCGGVPMAMGADGQSVYVAWRGATPTLFSFVLDPTLPALRPTGAVPLPASMCYASVAAGGRALRLSSYLGSTLAVCPIHDDGRVGEPATVLAAPHAHCVVQAANGLVYVASLLGDHVRIYRPDELGLVPAGQVRVPTGSGPRHLVFSADGRFAYLLSELSGTLASYAVDPDGGLSVRQTVSIVPEDMKPWAAELRLGPDDRTLFASERRTSRLLAFRLGPHGEMEPVCDVEAPECPRAFDLDASGRWLIALGETSGAAWIYAIEQNGGLLHVNSLAIGTSPSWLLSIPYQ